jgi:hypothetical protein
MHPSDTGTWTNLVRSFGFTVTDEPLHLLLPRSKVFLATVSSTIQWAVYLDVPTVNFDFYRYNYPDYSNLEDVLYVQRKSDLVPALSAASHKEFLRMRHKTPRAVARNVPMSSSIQNILSEIDGMVR